MTQRKPRNLTAENKSLRKLLQATVPVMEMTRQFYAAVGDAANHSRVFCLIKDVRAAEDGEDAGEKNAPR